VYSTEPGHEAIKGLLRQVDVLAIAWHGRAEFAAVLLRKRRESRAPTELMDRLAQQFRRDVQTSLIRFLPLTEAVMCRLESTLCTVPAETTLRAADALHLACAAEHGFKEVYSNDRQFLAAAPLFGLRGVNVI